MKYYEEVELKGWKNNEGFSFAQVIEAEWVDIDNMELAHPKYWWTDYSECPDSNCDDLLITVRIFNDDSHEEAPIAEYSSWESELFGPWHIREECLDSWGCNDPDYMVDYKELKFLAHGWEKDICELIEDLY